jgi:prefoldin subunit 5
VQYEQRSREWHSENVELREMLMRQSQDVDRLIEEKRELEELVEQQNQSIK